MPCLDLRFGHVVLASLLIAGLPTLLATSTSAQDAVAAAPAPLPESPAAQPLEASPGPARTLTGIAALQQQAVQTNSAAWGHWGPDPNKYSSWKTHSNRLIPIYSFGDSLERVRGLHSVYRDAARLEKLYGSLPAQTLNPTAEYFDQTDVYHLQRSSAQAGKKRIILVIFDGTDWQTTWAAAIAKTRSVPYTEGRGRGLSFQDYRGTATDFGYFVTSPHNEGTTINVDDQKVTGIGGKIPGGYDPKRAGEFPWSTAPEGTYLISAGTEPVHAYTDSASSATSMTCGIKTYNDAINVDFAGREAFPISRWLQEQGFAVGVVTSVPISHATPAAAYASNIHRDDYQDLTRDLIGLPSAYHPGGLPGVDVLIGAGWGEEKAEDAAQGKNFVPGNRYLTTADMRAIDAAHGGKYVIAQRTAGQSGLNVLRQGVQAAVQRQQRLLGYFGVHGVPGGHLPYQTADGRYDPVSGMGSGGRPDQAELYTPADIQENPRLAEMALAAADVLQSRSDRWWLMIEAGDVDWANHANNLDASIGALLSGEETFTALTQWIETHGGWQDTALYLTADHGHYLVIDNPQALAKAAAETPASAQ